MRDETFICNTYDISYVAKNNKLSPMEIYKLLPQTNCKECGEETCMAFAFKLLNKGTTLDKCTPLYEEEYKEERKELEKILKPIMEADVTETGLVIHEDLCFGCGNCVVACPVNVAEDPKGCAIGKGASSDKVILKVENGKVKAQNIERCRRFGEHKILCNACITPCPTKAIEFPGG
ncbi:(Fe-S)-binding protein [Candidatus Methanoliparum sp. LAM-1]|nr:(Fe-S)-binding protein [Candidatus Methanoliparum sp. LAM-1]BDC36066.1 tRNA CCA-pyrophosphorylase [Candidatus Methanoliparum sp. LAM-1]